MTAAAGRISMMSIRRIPAKGLTQVHPVAAARFLKQQVVVQFLHQQPLTPDAVEHLAQQRPEDLFRRDRRAADVRIQLGEVGREVGQDLVDHPPDLPKGMIRGNTILRGDVAEHPVLLSIVSAHRGLLRGISEHRTTMNDRVNEKMRGFSPSC
jgi:hypothetical protein